MCQALFEKIIDIKRFYAYTCDVLSKDVDKIYETINAISCWHESSPKR